MRNLFKRIATRYREERQIRKLIQDIRRREDERYRMRNTRVR